MRCLFRKRLNSYRDFAFKVAYSNAPMTDIDPETLAVRIRQSLGCSKDLAADYVKGISNPPEIIHGKIVVRDPEGRIVARVPESVLA